MEEKAINNEQQPDQGADTAQQDEKTFTQDDVNRIVSERLAKEKARSDATLAERERGLVQREFQLKAKEIFAEKKLPAKLLDALKAGNENELKASLAILEEEYGIGSGKPIPTLVLGGTGGSANNLGREPDIIREAMGLK